MKKKKAKAKVRRRPFICRLIHTRKERGEREMKQVAATLKDLPSSAEMKRIIDGRDDIADLVDGLKDHWRYDLFSRRPRPALLEGGALKPTDLDLACFLAALGQRGAVINLPAYERRRPGQIRQDERVVSKQDRHGQVLGLTSHQDVFSFSVRIKDANVVRTGADGREEIGAFRNFMLYDIEGVWYDGWNVIEFSPTHKENEFIKESGIATGNKIHFDNFVHPNRWVSFYGSWYFLTKCVIARLREEGRFLNQHYRQMVADNVGKVETKDEYVPTSSFGDKRTIKVDAFEAEVDVEGKPVDQHDLGFKEPPRTQAGLQAAYERRKRILFTDVPELQFAVRATELAFSKTLPSSYGMPGWIKGATWERDHKIKRMVWNRLVLGQSHPFERGTAIRYRVRKVSQQVAA